MAFLKQRLGVNLDHIATVRNARGTPYPDPAEAARLAERAGADSITIHLREDRRHIRDADLHAIRAATALPINLEMAATDEMETISVAFVPDAVCIVPEKRQEKTTEGGLEVVNNTDRLFPLIESLRAVGARISLFVEPDMAQITAAHNLGAHVVELHTGRYAEHVLADDQEGINSELKRIQSAAKEGAALGFEIHAGHGLTCANVGPVAAIAQIQELNIGHSIISDALFCGLEGAIKAMRKAMDQARPIQSG